MDEDDGRGGGELAYAKDLPANTTFYHGTKGDLKTGDLIRPGFGSNFVERERKHIYFSATLEAATWGAELARGEGRGRIYTVEPTGRFEDEAISLSYSVPFVIQACRCVRLIRSGTPPLGAVGLRLRHIRQPPVLGTNVPETCRIRDRRVR